MGKERRDRGIHVLRDEEPLCSFSVAGALQEGGRQCDAMLEKRAWARPGYGAGLGTTNRLQSEETCRSMLRLLFSTGDGLKGNNRAGLPTSHQQSYIGSDCGTFEYHLLGSP